MPGYLSLATTSGIRFSCDRGVGEKLAGLSPGRTGDGARPYMFLAYAFFVLRQFRINLTLRARLHANCSF
jgi:hypothetical protein